MKILLAAAVALVVALPAAARSPAPGPVGSEPRDCAVSVSFGSYAMGIDDRAFARVERYVARHRRLVARSSIHPWGREGERTVCITTTSRRAAGQVFADIKALIRRHAERGPTEVKTLDGRVWTASPGPPR